MRRAAVARAAAFLLVFWGCSALFPVSRRHGDVVVFRPPSAAFGVAWLLLSAAAAASWATEAASPDLDASRLAFVDTSFAVLLVLLVLYAAMSEKRVAAAWIVAGSLAAALTALAMEADWRSRGLMAPVVAWLVFALIMQAVLAQTLRAEPPLGDRRRAVD